MTYATAKIQDYLFQGIQIDRFSDKGGISILTHYHSDHVRGLIDKPRTHRLICSEATKCILDRTRSRLTQVVALPFGEALTLTLPTTSATQCTITLFETQHMIGSAMCLLQFAGSAARTIFYTGDYRLDGEASLPRLHIDYLFVDRTFHHVSSKCLPPLQESAQNAHRWLSGMLQTYRRVYIGYYHIGTCELLLALTRGYGYKFCVPESLPEYELCTADFMYGEIVDPDSRIEIVWLPRRKKNKPKPLVPRIPILLPSAQWETFTNRCGSFGHSTCDPVVGGYRLPFSTHATGDENQRLIDVLQPRRCFLIV
jgi:hypothetical protein